MTEQFDYISLDDISPNPYQPRLHFKEKDLTELAQSIKENGLIQPIIVRQSEIFGYELIAGERRFRAAQLAGLERLPAIIKTMSDDDSMKQAIIENLQRANLNPIEEAKAYRHVLDKTNITHEELASSMGKSRPYISNSLRLLNLPLALQEALENEELSQGHARLLVNLQQEEQLSYFHLIKDKQLSVRQLEKLLKDKQQPKKTSKAVNLFIQEKEKELSKALGLPAKITYNKEGKGKLIFNFSSEEEFTQLISKFK